MQGKSLSGPRHTKELLTASCAVFFNSCQFIDCTGIAKHRLPWLAEKIDCQVVPTKSFFLYKLMIFNFTATHVTIHI